MKLPLAEYTVSIRIEGRLFQLQKGVFDFIFPDTPKGNQGSCEWNQRRNF